MKKTMKIEGMMCGHCTGRVEKALNALDGVQAEVSLEDKAAYLTIDGDVSDDTLKKAVEDCIETEELVKTGRLGDQIGVELLIMKYSG